MDLIVNIIFITISVIVLGYTLVVIGKALFGGNDKGMMDW